MGMFDKIRINLDSVGANKNEKNLLSDDVIQKMLDMTVVCLAEGRLEHAFATYKQIVEMTPNATAQ